MTGQASDRLIVALDTGADEALELCEALQGHVRWVKVGMTLFYAHGPSIVRRISDMGLDVFLDLKLHDIPHQVGGAARSVAALGVGMLTVHASGGAEMMRAAADGAREGADAAGVAPPAVIGVTVLTSMDALTLSSVGVSVTPAQQVETLATLARSSGIDGVVCSPEEAATVRGFLGADALVVTPGVRPEGSAAGDQSRIATPARALAAGASHLVVGRPITQAPDPVVAAQTILAEMEGALR